MAHKLSPPSFKWKEERASGTYFFESYGITKAKNAVCTGEERRKLLKSFRHMHMQSIFPIPIIE